MPDRSTPAAPPTEPGKGRWLSGGVAGVGATSLFSDTGHEMVTAILPGFVTTVLGGSAAALGVIEGVSDALTGTAKLVGGPIADEPATRGRVAAGGYGATALATALIGLTSALWQVGVLRAIAWAARGFRSPARDALLAGIARPDALGRSFGVERAGDNLGAVIGPLLAGLLVGWIGLRPTILVSFVPGVLAAVTIGAVAAHVGGRRRGSTRASAPRGEGWLAGMRRLTAGYGALRGTGIARILLPIALFEGGNLAATLLILRSTQLLAASGADRSGFTEAAAVAVTTLFYAAHNAMASITSLAGGRLIDRIGARAVLAAGAVLYLIAYLGLALVGGGWPWLLVLFLLAGAGIGVVEPAQSALLAHAVPDRMRGSAFGALGTVQGAGDLTSTLVGGILFTVVSPAACFVYAAAWMLAAAVVAAAGPRRRIPHHPPETERTPS